MKNMKIVNLIILFLTMIFEMVYLTANIGVLLGINRLRTASAIESHIHAVIINSAPKHVFKPTCSLRNIQANKVANIGSIL